MSIKEYKLGEICFIKGNRLPKNISKKETNIKKENIPYLKQSNIRDYFVYESNRYIFPEFFNEFKNNKKDEIFIFRTCDCGRPFQVKMEKYVVDDKVYKIVPNEKIVLNKFLLYLLIKKYPIINNLGNGTTIKVLQMDKIKKINILIPSIIIQQQIIDIIEPFEKMLNIENNKIFEINIFLEMLANWLMDDKKINFIDLVGFSGKKYNNQKKYVDTSCISKSIFRGFEIIDEKIKSRANLTPDSNSIIFSKLKGENKIYPIYSGIENEFVFSTGFENIKSDFNAYVYGVMISDAFHRYKNLTCSGSVMEGINKTTINNWTINDIDKEKWDSKFNLLLELITLTNKKIMVINRIINLLIELNIK